MFSRQRCIRDTSRPHRQRGEAILLDPLSVSDFLSLTLSLPLFSSLSLSLSLSLSPSLYLSLSLARLLTPRGWIAIGDGGVGCRVCVACVHDLLTYLPKHCLCGGVAYMAASF